MSGGYSQDTFYTYMEFTINKQISKGHGEGKQIAIWNKILEMSIFTL